MTKTKNKKSGKNQREKLSLTLTLSKGCMSRLFKKYNTTQSATAIREAIHEVLGIKDESYDRVDTNSSRQRKKLKAKELGVSVSKLKEVMDENDLTLEDVNSSFF